MNFTVYIIYSPSFDKFYIGYTSEDVAIRLRKHNAKHPGFTGKKEDWVIKYTEVYNTKEAAMKREREIKSWKSRLKIIKLISIE